MAPSLRDSIEQQFKDLIKAAHEFVRAARESDLTLPPTTTAEVAAWVTRCGQLITLLSPNTSEYYQQYARALRTKNFYRIDRTNYRHLILIEGAVTALYDDYRRGLLRNLTGALQNEIFADFLDNAAALLEEGRCQPAAVIIGAVLESALIKLANVMNVNPRPAAGPGPAPGPGMRAHPGIPELNAALFKEGIYDKLTFGQVQSWAQVYDQAVRSEDAALTDDRVRLMLQFVQMFCAGQLS